MRHPSYAALALGFALALTGCSSTDNRDFDAEFADFDAEMDAFVAEQGLEGATAIVVHRELGVLHQQAYGDFELDRISLLASSGKIISVGVLMRLADEGLIDLDAPVSTYLSEWGEFKTDISVRQLLSNSSGLVGLIDETGNTDSALYGPYICQYVWTGTLEGCAKKVYTADDAADRVAPDTAFRYGGGAWQLAGGIAEVVTGKSWDQLVAETYAPCELDVLGFTNQYLDTFTGGGVDTALGYPAFFSGDISTLKVTKNPSIEGGSYTTIGDYGALLLMQLRGGECQGGRVLSEAAVTAMQTDRIGEAYDGSTIDARFPGYGLGWWVSRDEPIVADAGAYGAMPWLDLERGYGVMIIIEDSALTAGDAYSRMKPIVERIVDEIAPR